MTYFVYNRVQADLSYTNIVSQKDNFTIDDGDIVIKYM